MPKRDIGRDAGREETRARFVEMRAQGYTYSQIAEELHISKATVSTWHSELKHRIADFRAIELDALQSRYWLSHKRRIQMLGEQLQRLQDEAAKRDLSDIPTDKLYGLILKTYEQLKAEAIDADPLGEREVVFREMQSGY